MLLISHRGNLDGPNKERENSPAYILEACDAGFNVEIDVWFIDGEYYLGHDEPIYLIDEEFLFNKSLWCHAKNLAALEAMVRNKIHCFWHQEDDVTLTSLKFLWTYPGKELSGRSIAVMPEQVEGWDISNVYGVCTDYVLKYRD